jgi:hypothetical protein
MASNRRKDAMSDWVHDSLTHTIGCLREVGLIDLASDMERLLDSGELENLRLYRNGEIEAIAASTEDLGDEGELAGLLRRVAGLLSLRHATIHVVQETGNVTFSPKVVTTYPAEWIQRYVDRGYAKIDPVFPLAAERDAGFYWDEIDGNNPIVASFFQDARAFGVGRSGYTLPMRIWSNVKVALSVTSDLSAADFRAAFAPHRSDLEYLAEDLITAFCELAAQEFPPERHPPERQLRILHGLAHGRTLAELGRVLGVEDMESESRSICDFYQARTLLQAAMTCMRLNHLDDLKFDRSQIASDSLPENNVPHALPSV